MRHTMKEMFPESSQKRIQEAVKEAESRTSGEIVPFVVNRSDEYAEAEWRCGAFFAILALLVLSILRTVIWLWIPIDFTVTVLSILLSGLLGYLITRMSPWAKRLFAGTRLMERRVAQRAAGAFISEEVFNTRHRTGILIFLSLFERRVMVLGDTGINKKVQHEDWESITQRIAGGIISGNPVEGLSEGIRMSGELLHKHHVDRGNDDTDELPDSLRMSDT